MIIIQRIQVCQLKNEIYIDKQKKDDNIQHIRKKM